MEIHAALFRGRGGTTWRTEQFVYDESQIFTSGIADFSPGWFMNRHQVYT